MKHFRRNRQPDRLCRVLAAVILWSASCAAPRPPAEDLDEALGRLRQAFERGDEAALDGLYPAGWALVALPGETRRSVTGEELRRGFARFFRNRVPIRYSERPRSIQRTPDGDYVLFAPEWSSMATGTDRTTVEAFRIGLQRVPAEAAAADLGSASASWRIREFTVWTR